MARKFDEHEKERIHSQLLTQGKWLFETHGLRKTSVSDLTKAAGIAQGSFYLFYASKEELYFDILQQLEEQIRVDMVSKHFSSGILTRASFKQFLKDSLDLMETYPLIRQLYNEEIMETFVRKLPDKLLEQNFTGDADYLLPMIIQAQEQGYMAQKNPETIVSLLRSIILLSLQKRTIGEAHYENTMELLIDFIVDGLITEKEG